MSDHIIPWGKVEMPDGEFSFDFPPDFSLTIKRSENETHIHRTVSGEPVFHRFITGREHPLTLEPGLPDLPMTLKPLGNLSILPGKKLEAIVEVPLIVRILLGSSGKKQELMEFALGPLSRSFFGNPDSGEIAYFLESPFHTALEEYEKPDSSAYCPVTIVNRSVQNLEFERMILRVPYLSLYYGRRNVYSNPVIITFRGHDQFSQIRHKKSAPSLEAGLEFASSPRKVEENGILKRSFYFIKTLYEG